MGVELFNDLFYFLYLGAVFVCVCVYLSHRVQTRELETPELELQAFVSLPICMLETELTSQKEQPALVTSNHLEMWP